MSTSPTIVARSLEKLHAQPNFPSPLVAQAHSLPLPASPITPHPTSFAKTTPQDTSTQRSTSPPAQRRSPPVIQPNDAQLTQPAWNKNPLTTSSTTQRGHGRGRGRGRGASRPYGPYSTSSTPPPFIPTLTTSNGRRSLVATSTVEGSSTLGSATARAI